MNTTTKIFASIVVVVAIATGAFLYFTRAVQAPAGPIPTNGLTTTDSTQKKLSIVSSESYADFTLYEDLRGVKTKVVGTTNQIAGDIIVDTKNPAVITVGEIKVDARTLKTDNAQRDGAIARMILNTEQAGNEYLTFVPTSVTGIPAVLIPGASFKFQVVGELTVKGIAKLVTFDAEGVINQDQSLSATATTKIAYSEFGITIPSLPFLANVDKDVVIGLSIVAR